MTESKETQRMIPFLTLFMFLLQSHSFQGVLSTASKMTWIDSAIKCYSEGAVLESNLTVLQDYIRRNNLGSVWVGSYSAFLPWIEITGCFRIPEGSDVRELPTVEASTAQCQIKCFGSKYFALRKHENRCACFDTDNYVEKETADARSCNNRDVPLFAMVYTTLNNLQVNSSDPNNCFTSLCMDPENESRYTYDCKMYVKAVCRNLSISSEVPKHLQFPGYFRQCVDDGTFPFRWSQNICEIPHLVIGDKYWIGVYRQELTVEQMDVNDINQKDFTIHQQYIQNCSFTIKNGGTSYVSECYTRKSNFLCKTDSMDSTDDGYNGKSSVGMTHQTPEQVPADESASYTGVIVGTVVIVIIIATAVTAVLVYRIRIRSKPPKSSFVSVADNYINVHQGTEHLRNSIISNPNYSFANPLEKEEHISSEMSGVHDRLKADGKRKPNSNSPISENRSGNITYAKPFRTVNKEIIKEDEERETPSYSLAELVNEDDNDPYTSNKDYDHLHNVKKTENPPYKVYDHLTMPVLSDPTYDHMHLNASTLSDNDYDHFTGKDGK